MHLEFLQPRLPRGARTIQTKPENSELIYALTNGSQLSPFSGATGVRVRERNAAGGLLSAGGLGAIISPPVLGAAAFLIAEFLKISYLDVLLMAVIPTGLFYLALFLMVEIDARKYAMHRSTIQAADSMWNLTRKYWYHFLSLISIVIFMMMGFSPVMSVFWATIVSGVTSLLRSDTTLLPYDLLGRCNGTSWITRFWNSGLIKALENGSIGVLNVGATCAGAGIIGDDLQIAGRAHPVERFVSAVVGMN